MPRALAAALALLASLPGGAEDFPTHPDEVDRLCESLGGRNTSTLAARERQWFRENCTCAGAAGCGKVGSAGFYARVLAAKRRMDEQRAARARDEAEGAARRAEADARKRSESQRWARARKATEKPRRAFLACSARAPSCEAEEAALRAACRAAGIEGWGDCQRCEGPECDTGSDALRAELEAVVAPAVERARETCRAAVACDGQDCMAEAWQRYAEACAEVADAPVCRERDRPEPACDAR